MLFHIGSQTRQVDYHYFYSLSNGGHGIKPGKEIRCIKFEKEKENYFNLETPEILDQSNPHKSFLKT